MNNIQLSVITVWFYLIGFSCGARILGVFPAPFHSHYVLGRALMQGLADKGHDVTVISSFGEKNLPKNATYRDIVLSGLLKDNEQGTLLDRSGVNPFLNVPKMINAWMEVSEKTLSDEKVQNLLNSSEKFDVVIVEQFLNDALKGLAVHFNAPLIVFSTFGANYWVNTFAGNPAPPSYVSDLFLGYSDQMTLIQRLINGVMYLYKQAVHNLYLYPSQKQIARRYLPGNPRIDQIFYNVTLILLNSHPATNQAVPHVPNMIEIGGFHIHPSKKLPVDLQKFLDHAEEGVIYFNMGSSLDSSMFSNDKIRAFEEAFRNLKQKVLWKWEGEELPKPPPNVKLVKWVPQADVLAHPNIKLFITHGGLLSTSEAVYHGIPLLVIPFYNDQHLNARFIVDNEFGRSISYEDISTIQLLENIKEILHNSNYKENAQKRSKLYQDRPTSPLSTAIYWVEYVVRHKGAPHLRVRALDLPCYTYLLIDVIIFGLSTSLIIIYTIHVIIGRTLKKKTEVKASKLKKT